MKSLSPPLGLADIIRYTEVSKDQNGKEVQTKTQDFETYQNHDFWFNDLIFSVPPEKIYINEENAYAQTGAMRKNGTDKVPTGIASQVFTIAINIPYKNAILNIDERISGRNDTITTNTSKRGGLLDLIIQCKNVHFAYIENAYLRSKLRIPKTHNMVFCVHQLAISTSPNEPDNIVGTLTISPFNYTPFSDKYMYKKNWISKEGKTIEDVNPINLENRIDYNSELEGNPSILYETNPVLSPDKISPVSRKYLDVEDLNTLDQDVMLMPEPTRFPHSSVPFKFYIDYLHYIHERKQVSNSEQFDCTKISPYGRNYQNIGDTLVFKWKEFKSIPIPNDLADRIRISIKKQIINFRRQIIQNIPQNEDVLLNPTLGQSPLAEVSHLDSNGKIQIFKNGHSRVSEFAQIRSLANGPIELDGSAGSGYRFHLGVDIYPTTGSTNDDVILPFKIQVIKDTRTTQDYRGDRGGYYLRGTILEGSLQGKIVNFWHLSPNAPFGEEDILEAGTNLGLVGPTAKNSGIVSSSPHIHFELAVKDSNGHYVESRDYDKHPILYRLDPGSIISGARNNAPIGAINSFYQSIGQYNVTYENRNRLQSNISANEEEVTSIIEKARNQAPFNRENDNPWPEYKRLVGQAEDDGWKLYAKDLTTIDLFYKEHSLTISCNSSMMQFREEAIICDAISASCSNLFKKIPLSGIVTPTAQYLGQDDDSFLISLKSQGLNTIKKIEAIKEQLKIQAIRYKYIPEAFTLRCENSLINAFGNVYFTVIGTDSATVMGAPDLYATEMRLLSHNMILKETKINKINSFSEEALRYQFWKELKLIIEKKELPEGLRNKDQEYKLKKWQAIFNTVTRLGQFSLETQSIPKIDELLYRYNPDIDLIADATISQHNGLTELITLYEGDKLLDDWNLFLMGEVHEIVGSKEFDIPLVNQTFSKTKGDVSSDPRIYSGMMNTKAFIGGSNSDNMVRFNFAEKKWEEEKLNYFPPYIGIPRIVLIYVYSNISNPNFWAWKPWWQPTISEFPFYEKNGQVHILDGSVDNSKAGLSLNQEEALKAYLYHYVAVPMLANMLSSIDDIYNMATTAIDKDGNPMFPKTLNLIEQNELRSVEKTYEDLTLPLHPYYGNSEDSIFKGECLTEPDFYLMNPGIDTKEELRSDFEINNDGIASLRSESPSSLYTKYIDLTQAYAIADFEGFCIKSETTDGNGKVIPPTKLPYPDEANKYLRINSVGQSNYSERDSAEPPAVPAQNNDQVDWAEISSTLGDNTSLMGTISGLSLDSEFAFHKMVNTTLQDFNGESSVVLQRQLKDSFALSRIDDAIATVDHRTSYDPNSPDQISLTASPFMNSEYGNATYRAKLTTALANISKRKLAMRRAYPTCKIFFIEEDDVFNKNYVELDEYYSYSNVQSISISDSRKRPASVCQIVFNDPNGILSGFNQWNKALDPEIRTEGQIARDNKISDSELQLDSSNPFLKGTKGEQSSSNFVLNAGMKIKVKLGYSNDPYKLETVFLGEVSTVNVLNGGSSVEVTALSYGAELVAKKYGTTDDDTDYDYEDTFILLAKLMFQPEVIHFGRMKLGTFSLFTEDQSINKAYINFKENLGSGFIADPARREPGFYRTIFSLYNTGANAIDSIQNTFTDLTPAILGNKKKLTLETGPQDDNLYPPTMKAIQVKRWNDFSITGRLTEDEDLIKVGTKDKPQWMEAFTASEVSYNIFYSTIWDVFEEMTLRHPGYVKHPRIYEGADRMTMFFGLPDRGYWASSGKPMDTSRANQIFKRIIEESTVSVNKGETDRGRMIVPFDTGSSANPESYFAESGGDDSSAKLDLEAEQDQKIMIDKNLLEQFKSIVKNRFKPFRKYHHLNSFTDIISNEIEATAEGWATQVSVVYGSDNIVNSTAERGAENADGSTTQDPNSFLKMDRDRSVTVNANINLSASNIRNLSYQFPNAKSIGIAKSYAKSLLAKEAKDMYKGSLSVLGNSAIRPYDVCIIHDTYTNMYGPIEVEEVIHHYSPETGFITSIIPDALVFNEDISPYVVFNGLLPTVHIRTEKYMLNTFAYMPINGDPGNAPGESLFEVYNKMARQQEANVEQNLYDMRNAEELINDLDPFNSAGGTIGVYLTEIGSLTAHGWNILKTAATASTLGVTIEAGIAIAFPLLATQLGYFYLSSKLTSLLMQYMGDQKAYFMLPLVREGIPMTAGIDAGYYNSFYKSPLENIRSYLNDGTAGLSLQQSDMIANHIYQDRMYGENVGNWLKISQSLERFSFQWDAWHNQLATDIASNFIE